MVTLTLKAPLDQRIDARSISSDTFSSLSEREIAFAPLRLARERGLEIAGRGAKVIDRATNGAGSQGPVLELGELFNVSGARSASVRVVGDLHLVDGLGTGMAGGTLTIEGDVGRDLGRGMTGGAIAVRGSAGSGAARMMAGGTISISGDAGDGIGGPFPGGSRGMTGGEIVVRGNAARDAGFCIRRGLIVIAGNAADGAGRCMIAGTVIVMGRAAGAVGSWNKRGTVVALGGADIPETYRYACTYRPTFLRLVFAHLQRKHGLSAGDRFRSGRFARYCGDLSELGLGELLTWVTE